MFGVLKFRKCDLEDSLYITGDELEHPRELFLSLWSGGPLCCKPDTQHCKIMCDVVYIFYTGEGVSLDLRFLLGLSVFAMVTASASRAAAITSEINCQIVA
nr:hypothetical protein [Tanacetum cinerariifolium]